MLRATLLTVSSVSIHSHAGAIVRPHADETKLHRWERLPSFPFISVSQYMSAKGGQGLKEMNGVECAAQKED